MNAPLRLYSVLPRLLLSANLGGKCRSRQRSGGGVAGRGLGGHDRTPSPAAGAGAGLSSAVSGPDASCRLPIPPRSADEYRNNQTPLVTVGHQITLLFCRRSTLQSQIHGGRGVIGVGGGRFHGAKRGGYSGNNDVPEGADEDNGRSPRTCWWRSSGATAAA